MLRVQFLGLNNHTPCPLLGGGVEGGDTRFLCCGCYVVIKQKQMVKLQDHQCCPWSESFSGMARLLLPGLDSPRSDKAVGQHVLRRTGRQCLPSDILLW